MTRLGFEPPTLPDSERMFESGAQWIVSLQQCIILEVTLSYPLSPQDGIPQGNYCTWSTINDLSASPGKSSTSICWWLHTVQNITDTVHPTGRLQQLHYVKWVTRKLPGTHLSMQNNPMLSLFLLKQQLLNPLVDFCDQPFGPQVWDCLWWTTDKLAF